MDEVVGCKLRRDLIAVVLKQKISIHNFKDLSLFDSFKTLENPNSICAITEKGDFLVAAPSTKRGFVQVISCGEIKQNIEVEAYYNENVSKIMLTSDGSVMAIAPESGTTIKLFNPISN